MQDLPWRNIWSADNPAEVLNEHLLLLVERFVPTKIIRACRNKDKPWFDDQCRNRDVLMSAQSHKWWSTLKSAVFRLSSSLPLLFGRGGGRVWESLGKADLLSDHFDGKQSRESVDLHSLAIRLRVLPPLPSDPVR